jgi:hypothetical protein
LLLALLLALTQTATYPETLTGLMVRVTNGDNTRHKIRLTGIDAPERGQAHGTKSKERLYDSVAGENMVVERILNYCERQRFSTQYTVSRPTGAGCGSANFATQSGHSSYLPFSFWASDSVCL